MCSGHKKTRPWPGHVSRESRKELIVQHGTKAVRLHGTAVRKIVRLRYQPRDSACRRTRTTAGAHRVVFSHPDCTVGTGISPVQQRYALLADYNRRSGIALTHRTCTSHEGSPCPENRA